MVFNEFLFFLRFLHTISFFISLCKYLRDTEIYENEIKAKNVKTKLCSITLEASERERERVME